MRDRLEQGVALSYALFCFHHRNNVPVLRSLATLTALLLLDHAQVLGFPGRCHLPTQSLWAPLGAAGGGAGRLPSSIQFPS